MSYTISNTDGSTLVLLGDRKVDQSTTSLTLVGKNWAGYGEYLNNNFVKLLANSANSSSNPPRSPLKGQLWYDTTAKRLKVYDDSFKSISGAIVSSTRPVGMTSGDIWWDSANEQLNVYSNSAVYLVGPLFPSNKETGFLFPPTPVKDKDLTTRDVALLKNYGTLLGYISNEAFTIQSTSTYAYLTATTTATVKGLTVFGDINYSGKIKDRQLTLDVDFDVMFNTGVTTNRTIFDSNHIIAQNNAIIKMLKAMYPVNQTTGTMVNPSNSLSIEAGVPVGSEARVLCKFPGNIPPNQSLPGYQIRRFVAIGGNAHWNFVTMSNNSTLTNVVSTFYQGSF